MSASAPITTIRSRLGIEFGAHKMFAAGTTVTAFTKNPDLVDKIGLFHWGAKISIRDEPGCRREGIEEKRPETRDERQGTRA